MLWLRGDIREVEPRLKRAVTLMLLFLVGLVLVYSKWWAWYGGLAWGPRFFVFAAVPASVLLALAIGRAGTSPIVDGFALGVLALSSWVAVAGVVANWSSLEFCARDAFSRESLCWYSPEFSPLGQPLVHFPAISWPAALVAAYCVLVAAYLAAPLIRALAGAAKSRLEAQPPAA